MITFRYGRDNDQPCINDGLSCFHCKSKLGKKPFHRCGNSKSQNFNKAVSKNFFCSLYK